MNILQNKNLLIESKTSGAELTRIYSKKHNRDILWNGDSKYWGRSSPILFPIVGRLQDNETIIDDKIVSMSQHGFARDMDFTILDASENSISYSLISNETTKKYYPYSFELIIKYTLHGSSINVEWTVKNIDSRDIYFSIGAHPAFNLPFSSDEDFSDYYIEFNHKSDVEQLELDGPFVSNKVYLGNINKLDLKPEIFEKDALIYTNIEEITLHSNKNSNFIKLCFKDFPLVGIWTPYYKDTNSVAPFLCVEPWHGLADEINSDKIYKNKKYINKLSIGKTFVTSYDIEIG